MSLQVTVLVPPGPILIFYSIDNFWPFWFYIDVIMHEEPSAFCWLVCDFHPHCHCTIAHRLLQRNQVMGTWVSLKYEEIIKARGCLFCLHLLRKGRANMLVTGSQRSVLGRCCHHASKMLVLSSGKSRLFKWLCISLLFLHCSSKVKRFLVPSTFNLKWSFSFKFSFFFFKRP